MGSECLNRTTSRPRQAAGGDQPIENILHAEEKADLYTGSLLFVALAFRDKPEAARAYRPATKSTLELGAWFGF